MSKVVQHMCLPIGRRHCQSAHGICLCYLMGPTHGDDNMSTACKLYSSGNSMFGLLLPAPSTARHYLLMSAGLVPAVALASTGHVVYRLVCQPDTLCQFQDCRHLCVRLKAACNLAAGHQDSGGCE